MTKQTITEQEIALERDVEAAQQGVEEVLEQIRAGDPKATPETLEAAERRLRFAKAKAEGERTRRSEEAEAERIKRIEELGDRAKRELDPEALRKSRQRAEKALSAYVGMMVDHNDSLGDITGELSECLPLPDGWALDSTSAGASLLVAPDAIKPVRPMVEVRDLALEVLRRHLRAGYVSLGDDAY